VAFAKGESERRSLLVVNERLLQSSAAGLRLQSAKKLTTKRQEHVNHFPMIKRLMSFC
jgi:hypothetical protein